MAKKIYVKSNYFYIVDTETDYIFEGLAKEVRVRKQLETSDEFYFDNVNGFTEKVAFADIQDENGDAYTDLATFVTFYEQNTGNFNTPQEGGGADKENIVSGVVASGTNTYTATYVPTITEYEDGLKVLVRFTNGNSGASTINLNGLGAKTIVKGTSTALVSGDIPANTTLLLAYDGTNFVIVGSQLVNQFFDWSPTYGGFSTPPSGGVNRYCVQDKICNFYTMPTVNGTSNSATYTITLPFVAKNLQVIPLNSTIDNGVTAAGGQLVTTTGSNIATISKVTGAWSATGAKRAVVQGWYEIQ
jgi:hypothetical protein